MPDNIYGLTALKLLEFRESGCDWTIDNRIQQFDVIEDLFLNSSSATINDMTLLCAMGSLKRIIFNGLQGNIDLPDCITEMPLTRFSLSDVDFTGTTIPSSIGNFENMQIMSLRNLGLSGEIPLEVCNIETLASFNLSDNDLSGSLPACFLSESTIQVNLVNCGLTGDFPFESFGPSLGITNINGNNFTGDIGLIPETPGAYVLNFSGNQFTGELDANIFNKDWLLRVLLDDNNISGLSNWSGFGDRMAKLDVSGNRLDFDDLEQVDFESDVEFIYAPQQALSNDTTFILEPGEDISLSCEAGGMNTTYQWYKNGLEIDGATDPSLELTNLQVTDIGDYSCAAQNVDFPELTLNSAVSSLSIISSTNNPSYIQLYAYPNPTSNSIEVQLPSPVEHVRLINSLGKTIGAEISQLEGKLEIDLSRQVSGLYYIIAHSEFGVYRAKLIKK